MPDELQIRRAIAERQIPALKLLFSRFPEHEQAARLEDTQLAVERGSLNLSGLWLAEQHGQPVGAALLMHQADGVTLVWPPVVATAADEVAVRTALMEVLCPELDGPQVKFGQVLLSADEINECGWLADYGFESAAELFFLARSLAEPWDVPVSEDNLQWETFDESKNAARFGHLIERTYRDSLDCPRLNGTRTGVEAIAGHRLSGEFHPRGWQICQWDGRDAGVFMLNEHPDQDAVELVYFGVAPEFRGRDLGRRLIRDAIRTARDWNRAVLFLAVDAGNTFANRIYAEAGFGEVARRAVWLRFPHRSAQK